MSESTRLIVQPNNKWKMRAIGTLLLGAGIGLFVYLDTWHTPGLRGWGEIGFEGVLAFLGWVSWMMSGDTVSKGPCPSCGKELEVPSSKKDATIACACGAYVEPVEGELRIASENIIAQGWPFELPLPDKFQWPDGCCICQQPATKKMEESVTIAAEGQALKNAAASVVGVALFSTVGVGFVQRGGGTAFSIQVPYCEKHFLGVVLVAGRHEDKLGIMFNSRPFMRAFARVNGFNELARSRSLLIDPPSGALAASGWVEVISATASGEGTSVIVEIGRGSLEAGARLVSDLSGTHEVVRVENADSQLQRKLTVSSAPEKNVVPGERLRIEPPRSDERDWPRR